MKFYVLTVLPFVLSSALTCLQKFFSLLENMGGMRAFPLLFFLTTNGVLKRILECEVLWRMRLKLTFLYYRGKVSVDTLPEACLVGYHVG